MNQIFSFKRYWWLVKRQWYENATTYKWGIVSIMVGIPFLFWFFNAWGNLDNPRLKRVDTLLLVLGLICLYGAYYFIGILRPKRKRMSYFSLPFTPLERVSVAFTFAMALMPILIMTVFTVSDFIFVQLFNHIHETSEQMLFKLQTPSSSGPVKWVFGMLGMSLCFTSIFALGSLMFGVKGPIASIIFIVVLTFIYDRYVMIFGKLPDFIESIVIVCLIPIFCLAMMYFIMKRKEA